MVDGSVMLSGLREALPSISILIQGIGALAGLFFVASGVWRFYEISNQNPNVTLTSPWMYLLSGVLLLNLLYTAQLSTELLFAGQKDITNILGYDGEAGMASQTRLFLKTIFELIRVIGLFFFIKGLMTLRKIGSPAPGGEHPHTAAMFQILCGTAAIHIVDTVNLVSRTFGFGSVL